MSAETDRERRLLDAALVEFSKKGLQGARTAEIAKRAGVNKQLIHHYFGTKEGLFIAALEEAYLAPRRKDDRMDFDALAPLDALRAFIKHIAETTIRHSQLQMLIIDENMHRGRHLGGLDSVRIAYGKLVAALDRILKRGSEAGVMRGGLDTNTVYLFIISFLALPITTAHTLSGILGIDVTSKEKEEEMRERCIDLLLNGLGGDAGSAAG